MPDPRDTSATLWPLFSTVLPSTSAIVARLLGLAAELVEGYKSALMPILDQVAVGPSSPAEPSVSRSANHCQSVGGTGGCTGSCHWRLAVCRSLCRRHSV